MDRPTLVEYLIRYMEYYDILCRQLLRLVQSGRTHRALVHAQAATVLITALNFRHMAAPGIRPVTLLEPYDGLLAALQEHTQARDYNTQAYFNILTAILQAMHWCVAFLNERLAYPSSSSGSRTVTASTPTSPSWSTSGTLAGLDEDVVDEEQLGMLLAERDRLRHEVRTNPGLQAHLSLVESALQGRARTPPRAPAGAQQMMDPRRRRMLLTERDRLRREVQTNPGVQTHLEIIEAQLGGGTPSSPRTPSPRTPSPSPHRHLAQLLSEWQRLRQEVLTDPSVRPRLEEVEHALGYIRTPGTPRSVPYE